MAFVKPYTYVDGAVLTADNQEANEQALQLYVNQQIVAGDIAVDSVVGESIATPRFVNAVNTAEFVTKTIQGRSMIRLRHDFAYFSATTKGRNQTSTSVEDYQSLNTTGAEVVIYKNNTKVMITIYFKAVGDENTPTGSGRYPGNGDWDNTFKLQYEKDGLITTYGGTRSYVFEDTLVGSASGVFDPGLTGIPAGHRSIMISRMIQLDVGRYKFSVAVNPKLEKGNINCQSFLIETFHV